MAPHVWTLVDLAADKHIDSLALGPLDVGGSPPFSLVKKTLRGGPRDGVEIVVLDNGRFRACVLLTRGLGLWRAASGGLDLEWQAPVNGPVHPSQVPLMQPDGLGWLYGFDELLVRCGLESNGPPVFDEAGKLVHPLHGRIANTPAHKVELIIDVEAGEIRLVGEVDEKRLFGQKLRLTTTYRLRFGEARLDVTDEVTNIGATTADLELLYHINLGPPLLEPGGKFLAPIAKLAPKTPEAAAGLATWNTYPSPKPGVPEQVFLMELAARPDGWTEAALLNAAGNRGMSVHCQTQQLPYFVLWKNPIDERDGYVTGLEPSINFPNPKPYEAQNGRVLQIPPGASYRAEFAVEALPDADSVAAARARIDLLARDVTPVVADQPLPGWSA